MREINLTIKESIIQLLPRKIIAASIGGSLFAVLFAAVQPNPFGEDIHSIWRYLEAFLLATPAYLLYSYPVILVYGVLTSVISDSLSKLIMKNNKGKTEHFLSLCLHLVFGLVLLWISIAASMIYYFTDRFLSRKKPVYKWREALKSLLVPLSVWILFMGVIWFFHFIENWSDYIVH